MPHEDMHGKANRLVDEKSPYLLQHAYNPVDWFPWGEEAFTKADEEDKPVFLSVGYSTCHWCHNMARESFEDEEIAEILNNNFVPIKVDREERPDIDQLYMSTCQLFIGQGGWPLTVILTPQKVPFFAGTYFPKEGKHNMPGLKDILHSVIELWSSNRKDLEKRGQQILRSLKEQQEQSTSQELGEGVMERAVEGLKSIYDGKNGGFGHAPKFPMPHVLNFLLRWWQRNKDDQFLSMVTHTLEQMYRGGIFDQLGFGFHRYSVDEKWLFPHFEKMLYDQALLGNAYLEAYQAAKKESLAEAADKIFTYVLEGMQDANGGFYSAENAESEGIEGKYYLWTKEEIMEVLGSKKGEVICDFFGVTSEGNFQDGYNVLYLPLEQNEFLKKHGINLREWHFPLEESRRTLLETRQKRTRPSIDDKVLTSWNGLMISALARGAGVLKTDIYSECARRAADFILQEMMRDDGILLHRYRDGEASIKGFLEDYAYFTCGLLDLYEATFDSLYLKKALQLNSTMLNLFWSEEERGLFCSSRDDHDLPVQVQDIIDGALPSANSVAIKNLLRLAAITLDESLRKRAQELMAKCSGHIVQSPSSYTAMLDALDFALGPVQEIVVAGDTDLPSTAKMLREVHLHFLPRKVALFSNPAEYQDLQKITPLLEDKPPEEGKTSGYLCKDFSCLEPVTNPDSWRELLQQEE